MPRVRTTDLQDDEKHTSGPTKERPPCSVKWLLFSLRPSLLAQLRLHQLPRRLGATAAGVTTAGAGTTGAGVALERALASGSWAARSWRIPACSVRLLI